MSAAHPGMLAGMTATVGGQFAKDGAASPWNLPDPTAFVCDAEGACRVVEPQVALSTRVWALYDDVRYTSKFVIGYPMLANVSASAVALTWNAGLPDNIDPVNFPPSTHTGRKWLIDTGMTDKQILNTLLAAILAFAEHEIRERFIYKGEHLYMPHH